MTEEQLVDKTVKIVADLENRICQVEDKVGLVRAINQNFHQIIKDGVFIVDFRTDFIADYDDLAKIVQKLFAYVNPDSKIMDIWVFAVFLIKQECCTPNEYLVAKIREQF